MREAVYEGIFGTPKTEAGLGRVPLSVAAMHLIEAWQRRTTAVESEALVFATWSGKPISPNNVLKHIVAAAKGLGLGYPPPVVREIARVIMVRRDRRDVWCSTPRWCGAN